MWRRTWVKLSNMCHHDQADMSMQTSFQAGAFRFTKICPETLKHSWKTRSDILPATRTRILMLVPSRVWNTDQISIDPAVVAATLTPGSLGINRCVAAVWPFKLTWKVSYSRSQSRTLKRLTLRSRVSTHSITGWHTLIHLKFPSIFCLPWWGRKGGAYPSYLQVRGGLLKICDCFCFYSI